MRIILTLGLLTAAAAAQTPSLPPDYAEKVAQLEQARRAEPRNAEVLEALAGSYAMAGRHQQAVAALKDLLEITGSEDARLNLGRNQSWAGDTDAAIKTYEQYLKARPADRAATMELIRMKRWSGDYLGAEELCDRLLTSNYKDAKVLALKAETLHWAGNRGRMARHSAEAAATYDPELLDARVARIYSLRDQGERTEAVREFRALSDQITRRGGFTPDATYGDAYRLLETEFARSGHVQRPTASVYNDSDGIHNLYTGFQALLPAADHKLRLDLAQYRTSAPLGGSFTAGRDHAMVSEFTAGSVIQVAPSVWVTSLGGASRRSSSSTVRPIFDVQATTNALDRWTFDFAAGREFLKVTPRAVDRNMSSYRLGGGAQYHFDPRTSLAVRFERRLWSDDNRSNGADASVRRILVYHRPFMIDAGVQSHWESFDRDTRFASGFFTPERYHRHDGFLGLHGELNHKMRYEIRGAAGAQELAARGGYRPSWEIAASTSVRLSGPLELWAGYQRRNYSLISRDGWYHGLYVTLGIRP